MRVLNLIRSVDPVHGGPAEGLRQSVRAAQLLGHEQEVLTLDSPSDAWVRDFPAATHALGPVAGNYGFTRRLRPWLTNHVKRYDAMVVHGLWQYHGWAARQAALQVDLPYFVYCHGMLDPWFKRRYPLKHLKKWLYWPWAEYRVLRDARAVLFTAEDEARLAAHSFWLYRAHPAVVGYGVALGDDAARAPVDGLFAAWPALKGKRLLLFLGRLHPKKGCDLLIEAFARVVDGGAGLPDLHLVIAGPDPVREQARLQALAHRLGVLHRITWTGMLQGELKWAALRAAEVFVLPSHQENFGIAVVEALAVGTPVLISERVNIWREIVDGGAGLAATDNLEGCLVLLDRWLSVPRDEQPAWRSRAEACFERHFQMLGATRRLFDTIRPHVGRAHGLGPPAPVLDSQP